LIAMTDTPDAAAAASTPATPVAHDHAGRIRRAAAAAGDLGVDAVVIAPGPDLIYLTGHNPPPLERLTALLLRPGDDPVFMVPQLEEPGAASSPGGASTIIETWPDGGDPYPVVAKILGPAARRIAVSDGLWALHLLALQRALPDGDFGSASPIMSPLRARKDAGEIALLSAAGRAADRAFAAIVGEGLGGRSERAIAEELAGHLLAEGHESVGFTIVGSGPNGASPHHEAGDRVVEPGDVVVLDFGGTIGGYCSDMTRTVSVGPAAEEVRRVYDVVRAAQQAAFDTAAAGITGEQVDLAARGVIDVAGYGERFIHRTGHGIGLDVHEDPYLVVGNHRPLEPGNCFSIEPGIYLEGRFGVRIEDIVTLTEHGPVRLNEATRELLSVD
jgi:Xaa-Pro aminopeptidase